MGSGAIVQGVVQQAGTSRTDRLQSRTEHAIPSLIAIQDDFGTPRDSATVRLDAGNSPPSNSPDRQLRLAQRQPGQASCFDLTRGEIAIFVPAVVSAGVPLESDSDWY